MGLDIIISHGMECITIHDQLHMDMEFIGIHTPAGDFLLDSDMDGLAGDSIPTDEDIGGREVIEEDIGMDIMVDIIMVEEQVFEQDIGQESGILQTCITTDLME